MSRKVTGPHWAAIPLFASVILSLLTFGIACFIVLSVAACGASDVGDATDAIAPRTREQMREGVSTQHHNEQTPARRLSGGDPARGHGRGGPPSGRGPYRRGGNYRPRLQVPRGEVPPPHGVSDWTIATLLHQVVTTLQCAHNVLNSIQQTRRGPDLPDGARPTDGRSWGAGQPRLQPPQSERGARMQFRPPVDRGDTTASMDSQTLSAYSRGAQLPTPLFAGLTQQDTGMPPPSMPAATTPPGFDGRPQVYHLGSQGVPGGARPSRLPQLAQSNYLGGPGGSQPPAVAGASVRDPRLRPVAPPQVPSRHAGTALGPRELPPDTLRVPFPKTVGAERRPVPLWQPAVQLPPQDKRGPFLAPGAFSLWEPSPFRDFEKQGSGAVSLYTWGERFARESLAAAPRRRYSPPSQHPQPLGLPDLHRDAQVQTETERQLPLTLPERHDASTQASAHVYSPTSEGVASFERFAPATPVQPRPVSAPLPAHHLPSVSAEKDSEAPARLPDPSLTIHLKFSATVTPSSASEKLPSSQGSLDDCVKRTLRATYAQTAAGTLTGRVVSTPVWIKEGKQVSAVGGTGRPSALQEGLAKPLVSAPWETKAASEMNSGEATATSTAAPTPGEGQVKAPYPVESPSAASPRPGLPRPERPGVGSSGEPARRRQVATAVSRGVVGLQSPTGLAVGYSRYRSSESRMPSMRGSYRPESGSGVRTPSRTEKPSARRKQAAGPAPTRHGSPGDGHGKDGAREKEPQPPVIAPVDTHGEGDRDTRKANEAELKKKHSLPEAVAAQLKPEEGPAEPPGPEPASIEFTPLSPTPPDTGFDQTKQPTLSPHVTAEQRGETDAPPQQGAAVGSQQPPAATSGSDDSRHSSPDRGSVSNSPTGDSERGQATAGDSGESEAVSEAAPVDTGAAESAPPGGFAEASVATRTTAGARRRDARGGKKGLSRHAIQGEIPKGGEDAKQDPTPPQGPESPHGAVAGPADTSESGASHEASAVAAGVKGQEQQTCTEKECSQEQKERKSDAPLPSKAPTPVAETRPSSETVGGARPKVRSETAVGTKKKSQKKASRKGHASHAETPQASPHYHVSSSSTDEKRPSESEERLPTSLTVDQAAHRQRVHKLVDMTASLIGQADIVDPSKLGFRQLEDSDPDNVSLRRLEEAENEERWTPQDSIAVQYALSYQVDCLNKATTLRKALERTVKEVQSSLALIKTRKEAVAGIEWSADEVEKIEQLHKGWKELRNLVMWLEQYRLERKSRRDRANKLMFRTFFLTHRAAARKVLHAAIKARLDAQTAQVSESLSQKSEASTHSPEAAAAAAPPDTHAGAAPLASSESAETSAGAEGGQGAAGGQAEGTLATSPHSPAAVQLLDVLDAMRVSLAEQRLVAGKALIKILDDPSPRAVTLRTSLVARLGAAAQEAEDILATALCNSGVLDKESLTEAEHELEKLVLRFIVMTRQRARLAINVVRDNRWDLVDQCLAEDEEFQIPSEQNHSDEVSLEMVRDGERCSELWSRPTPERDGSAVHTLQSFAFATQSCCSRERFYSCRCEVLVCLSLYKGTLRGVCHKPSCKAVSLTARFC
ncbi:UNVERIFIED_CONTAM: hypothetical protein HHA_233870 [Hammondia hammondi]|eukprot:XP_008882732.1 hypothetical protein HHA_233870 [Hammondia hammondi]